MSNPNFPSPLQGTEVNSDHERLSDKIRHETSQEDTRKSEIEFAEVSNRVIQTLTSKLGLVEEAIVLPIQLSRALTGEELPDDTSFRLEVEEVLADLLPKNGNVLIIENIATQHAVATTPAYLAHNIDSYFTFIPEDTDRRPDFLKHSYYHPERVMNVTLAYENRIQQGKDNITPETLKGIRIVIDPHADFELDNGLFSKFFPSEEKLIGMGVTDILLMGEFSPSAAAGLTERRIDRKEDWDSDPMYDYLRLMKSKGYSVSLVGVDTRQPHLSSKARF